MKTERNILGRRRPSKEECEKYRKFCSMHKRLQELNIIIENLPTLDNPYYPINLNPTLSKAVALMRDNLKLGTTMLEQDYKKKKIKLVSYSYGNENIEGEIVGFSHWGNYAPFFNAKCHKDNREEIYQVMLGDFIFKD